MIPDKANVVGRTGQVSIRDFDEGVVRTLGGELVDTVLDGEPTQAYAVRIDGVNGPDMFSGAVPIIFSYPEDVYSENFLPFILVMRSSVAKATQRGMYGGFEYMVDAGRLAEGGRLVEIKDWSMPFDLTYDIQVRARLRRDAEEMAKHVGRIFLGWQSQVWVTDSLGTERGYDCIAESIDPMDEVNDVTNRTVGYTLSIRVMGELDLHEPVRRIAADRLTVHATVRE